MSATHARTKPFLRLAAAAILVPAVFRLNRGRRPVASDTP